MKMKHIIILLMGSLSVISSLVFTVISYKIQSRAMIEGLDDKLLTAVYFNKSLLGDDFHDNITDANSVSIEDYRKIVITNNDLCKKLNLEYIWSLLLTEDSKTVFTSATSTSKDYSVGDHASFFETHSAPELYTSTFETMKIHYQNNDDKWGTVRVVLVPFTDKHQRSYLFGACIKTAQVDAVIKATLIKCCTLGFLITLTCIFLSLIVANYFVRPIEQITSLAQNIASGNLSQEIASRGSLEMKSLSRSINKMSKSIRSQLKRLQFANKELKEIVYISSHDLKYPLMNIQRSGSAMQESCDNLLKLAGNISTDPLAARQFDDIIKTDIQDSLQGIKSGSDQIRLHLDGMLNISKIGCSEFHETTVDMTHLLDEVRCSVRFQVRDCEATLTVQSLPECFGDKELITQVFTNLIDNALKYRHPSRKPVIAISGSIEGSRAIYCVKDNGIGIDEDYHENVFEIFRRLNPEGDINGEGLGLTIVVRIMERLDGDIWIQSEPDKGSSFFVAIPIQSKEN